MSRRTIIQSVCIFAVQLTVLILFKISDAFDAVFRVLPVRRTARVDVDLTPAMDSAGTPLAFGDRVSRDFDGRLGTVTGESHTGPGVTVSYDGGGGETIASACGWTKI